MYGGGGGRRRVIGFAARAGFYRPDTVCHEKIVLKIKSILMQATNNLFRKVHNYTHFKG